MVCNYERIKGIYFKVERNYWKNQFLGSPAAPEVQAFRLSFKNERRLKMEKFVVEYAKYRKQRIYGASSYSAVDNKDALSKIDKAVELCDCGCIGNEDAIRIISEA